MWKGKSSKELYEMKKELEAEFSLEIKRITHVPYTRRICIKPCVGHILEREFIEKLNEHGWMFISATAYKSEITCLFIKEVG